jgi:hypothetical protein
MQNDMQSSGLTRRRVLGGMGVASLALMSSPASAQERGRSASAGRPEHADDHHILSAKGSNDSAAYEPAMA